MKFFAAATLLLPFPTFASDDPVDHGRRLLRGKPMDGLSVAAAGGRSLQMDDHPPHFGEGDHSSMHFVKSVCNDMLDTAECTPWSSYFNGADMTQEIKIPCGVCVSLDASPDDPLYGSTMNFGQGLNIVGKMVIPNDAKVHIVTKYVYVQGELIMPQPADGSSSGVPSPEQGDITRITLYGTDDLMFQADDATDNTHLGMKDVSAKAFVVAGGRVDIRALDPTCPSWLKLQSIQYGTPLPNVALNKPTDQSSSYEYNGVEFSSSRAVDGDLETTAHTICESDEQPWWEIDLQDMYTVDRFKIHNQKHYSWRFRKYTIDFMDAAKNVVHSIYGEDSIGDSKIFDRIGAISFRYMKISLAEVDTCLHFAELEVYGYPSSLPEMPHEYLDVLTVGEDAARCWSTKGSRILLTSDTFSKEDNEYFIAADVPYTPGSDKVYMLPMNTKKTAADDTFGYPDFAVEVALLDRSLVIEGTQDEGEFADLGGHFVVLHTPHIHQHLEGALLHKMGQQGRLGRYPLHFHMSECVHGSTLAKNVIWESSQRCVVIHGSHNVTVSENVAFDTHGHCYILEDGGEWDNSFLYNLGAKTKDMVPNPVVPDGDASTFWITNTANHWKGNVAAGGNAKAYWFELFLSGPSKDLAINQRAGFNPKTNYLGTFEDNTAHSYHTGFATYWSGYEAPPDTIWTNINAYKNSVNGLFHHGTRNIALIGGLLADCGAAARNFGHANAVYDGVQVIGRSEHVQSLIDEGRIEMQSCDSAGGMSVQPNQGMNQGTIVKNSVFSGFDATCTGGRSSAIYFENGQVRNGVLDTVPMFLNNTFGPNDAHISACMSINESEENWVRYIAVEDDGSMSGTNQPGFYVQDEPAITNFIDEASCEETFRCLRFCPGVCLQLGIVSISSAYTTQGLKMHIQDGSKSATVDRGRMWNGVAEHHWISYPMPMILPAPTSGKYTISFTTINGDPAWPGYAKLQLNTAPACSGGYDESQISFDMPPPDDRCNDLFYLDDFTTPPLFSTYPGMVTHGWQNYFTGGFLIDHSEPGLPFFKTRSRSSDAGFPYILRYLDTTCFAGLGRRQYTLSMKIRIADTNGTYVETDGSSEDDKSPRIFLNIQGLKSWEWRVPTNGDGSWHQFTKTITLPIDSSSAISKASNEAYIRIDNAWGNEIHLKGDWSMVLEPIQQQCTDSSCAETVINPCEERMCNLDTGLCGDFTPIQGCENGARLDRWLDIGWETNVEDLTKIPSYPDSPDETQFLGASLETPSHVGDGFGNRLQTYIMPPVTCEWNFYIASDDSSKLYLSSNDDPANKNLVASVDGWTHSKEWTKYGEAQKGTVSLVKGELYYLEAIHKEGGGGDNLAVGWECLEHGIALQVISAEYTTASFLPTDSPTISPTKEQCTDDSSCAGGVTNPCDKRMCNLDTGLCGSPTPIQGCENGARLDRWLDIGWETNVEDLTKIPSYPDSPDETQFLGASLETPSHVGDGFGNRLQTYIMPPVTCEWNFYIASDDSSKLYLSSNDDPANKNLVASVDGWTHSKEWTKYGEAQKGTVSLVQGELYYLEAIHKEGGGGDNLAVGWECLEHGIALQVISAEYTTVSIGADVSLQ